MSPSHQSPQARWGISHRITTRDGWPPPGPSAPSPSGRATQNPLL